MKNIAAPATQESTWKAFFGVLLCAVLWGSAFPSIKSVYAIWEAKGIDVSVWTRWWFAGVRFALAGLILLMLAKNPWAQLRKTSLPLLISMSLCQTFFQYLLFYTALAFASGSLCSLMTASGSFWWLLLAPLFGKAVWGGWKVWGILLIGAIGVGFAVYSPSDVSVRPMVGIGIMLLANLGGALAVLIFGKVKGTMGSRAATGFSLFLGGLGLCICGSSAITETRVLFSKEVICITLYLSCVSAVAFSLWNELTTRYSVSLLATYRFTIPIMGVTLSVLILEKEHFTSSILTGAGMVALAMYFAQRMNSRKTSAK